MPILGLIHEALEANDKVWGQVHQLIRKDNYGCQGYSWKGVDASNINVSGAILR